MPARLVKVGPRPTRNVRIRWTRPRLDEARSVPGHSSRPAAIRVMTVELGLIHPPAGCYCRHCMAGIDSITLAALIRSSREADFISETLNASTLRAALQLQELFVRS